MFSFPTSYWLVHSLPYDGYTIAVRVPVSVRSGSREWWVLGECTSLFTDTCLGLGITFRERERQRKKVGDRVVAMIHLEIVGSSPRANTLLDRLDFGLDRPVVRTRFGSSPTLHYSLLPRRRVRRPALTASPPRDRWEKGGLHLLSVARVHTGWAEESRCF